MRRLKTVGCLTAYAVPAVGSVNWNNFNVLENTSRRRSCSHFVLSMPHGHCDTPFSKTRRRRTSESRCRTEAIPSFLLAGDLSLLVGALWQRGYERVVLVITFVGIHHILTRYMLILHYGLLNSIASNNDAGEPTSKQSCATKNLV